MQDYYDCFSRFIKELGEIVLNDSLHIILVIAFFNSIQLKSQKKLQTGGCAGNSILVFRTSINVHMLKLDSTNAKIFVDLCIKLY